MTPVDLDALKRHLDANGSLDDGPEYQTIEALVAELRAAREVVKAANDLPRTVNTNRATRDEYANQALDRALVAYDQAVAP